MVIEGEVPAVAAVTVIVAVASIVPLRMSFAPYVPGAVYTCGGTREPVQTEEVQASSPGYECPSPVSTEI